MKILSIDSAKVERLLDKIADTLILSTFVDRDKVLENQKFIRDGVITYGADSSTVESIALYQKDFELHLKANY